MHSLEIRSRARQQYLAGSTVAEVARHLGLPYPTVRHWCKDRAEPKQPGSQVRCFRCRSVVDNPTDPASYVYLLGLYLGDGHLVTTAHVPVLVQQVQKQGCVGVQSYGVHWPCLFPQHGPGKKHERQILLADWQREIVERHPGDFLRGLFHSDGWRGSNRITVRGKRYVYPRYMFINESADIMGLCQWALDLLGIAWRMNRRNSLSVARREAVAALDRHVGPKS
ncbi:terminase gpP N-terminus-related DNA-binding protein [Micromonospora inositola]|uniref:Putative ATPase subunit of terminase (GpP-like) n=1 Tax=Micromonospora inositola TaxID=47865 RepID=A0A1C5J044_9ACTN|nr:transcriptional regulator [Micromonospora inositola]SCG63853.1 Putative ATPase subunit of terminase (gpP-like) [Micromonospora inositola]